MNCKHIIYLCLLLFYSLFSWANDDELEEELRYLHAEHNGDKFTTGNHIAQTVKYTPSAISVITEEDILNSGARDLIDILRLIPGFDFGVDVLNMVGPSIRNNWAYEGGILLLIDGIEMNERRYGTIQLGHHYPIDHIQKIEIMRGPGSIVYGGFARLGVINIISKSAKKSPDFSIIARYGKMQKGQGHQSLHFYAAHQFNSDTNINLTTKISKAYRSDRLYQDSFGNTISLANANQLNDIFANIGFQSKYVDLRFLIDDYRSNSEDDLLEIIPANISKTFTNYVFDLKYHRDITSRLQLKTNFNYSNQLPWSRKQFIAGKMRYTDALLSQRYLAEISANYHANHWLDMSGGIQLNYEKFNNIAGQYDEYHTPDQLLNPLPNYMVITPYVESIIKTDWGQLNLGLRYDQHNIFQANLSPRLGLTYQTDDWHYKLLYTSSFRAPTIENHLLNHFIRPERTRSYELELGYQFNSHIQLTLNSYYLSTIQKIVYGNTIEGAELQYNTLDLINTIGIETQLSFKYDWGNIDFNHSYSQMLKNATDYQPIDNINQKVVDSTKTLAFPSHKFVLKGHFELTNHWSINPALIISTNRYGYDQFNADNQLLLKKYPAEVLANIYCRYQDFLIKDLEFGFGIYDILGTHHQFIQPYNSGHAPLPDRSREFIVKFAYQF